MIIITYDDNDKVEVVSFDELQKRFPFTSFCVPVNQSTLPDGYFLVEGDEKPNTLREVREKIIFDGVDRKIIWQFVNSDEDDRLLIEKHVYSEIEKLTRETDWAVRTGVPDFISNKYKEYRDKLWNIPNQEGFPFNIDFPEIE